MRMIRLAFAMILIIVAADSAAAESDWPEIREFEFSVGIQMDADRIDIEFPIYGSDGLVHYNFVCRGGDYDSYVGLLLGKEDASYMSPLTCALYLGRGYRYGSLLGEDASVAYFSRGKIDPFQLLGECAEYPEFGRLRHFRLRGFELTLEFSDIVEGRPNLNSDFEETIEYVVMRVSAKPDATAKTSIAERPGYLTPKPSIPGEGCDNIRVGREPLMCRNPQTFSWEECPVGYEYERGDWEQDYVRKQNEEREVASTE